MRILEEGRLCAHYALLEARTKLQFLVGHSMVFIAVVECHEIYPSQKS